MVSGNSSNCGDLLRKFRLGVIADYDNDYPIWKIINRPAHLKTFFYNVIGPWCPMAKGERYGIRIGETAEEDVIKRIRSIWYKRHWEYDRDNLKNWVKVLGNLRHNKKMKPEEYALKDQKRMDYFYGSGSLSHNKEDWRMFCKLDHELKQTRWKAPVDKSPVELPDGQQLSLLD